MAGTDLIAAELRRRELAEDPSARAARRAYHRWLTQLRLWAAMERAGITDPGEQARFMCHRLYPDVAPGTLEQLADVVERNAREGRPLVRPDRAADTVGPELERLMMEHGYPVEA